MEKIDKQWYKEVRKDLAQSPAMSAIQPVNCCEGIHSALGVALTAQKRVLNTLCHEDGDRLYNVNVFSLNGVKDVCQTLAMAQAWLTKTWALDSAIPADMNWGSDSRYTSDFANYVWESIGSIGEYIDYGANKYIDENGGMREPSDDSIGRQKLLCIAAEED